MVVGDEAADAASGSGEMGHSAAVLRHFLAASILASVAADPPNGGDLEAARLELLGRLLPAALHELANPLVALVGTVELLLRDAEPGPAHARLELVERTAEEIAALVRSLQRLTRERLEPRAELDLGSFTRETADLAVRFSGVKGIGGEVRAPVSVTVVAEPPVLRQALLALLLDALQTASTDVEVEVDAGGVRVSAGAGGGRVATLAAAALGARLQGLPGGGAFLGLGATSRAS
jgi:signal transduction histidine kinase